MHHLLEFQSYHSPRLLKGAQTLPQGKQQAIFNKHNQTESKHKPLTLSKATKQLQQTGYIL